MGTDQTRKNGRGSGYDSKRIPWLLTERTISTAWCILRNGVLYGVKGGREGGREERERKREGGRERERGSSYW